MYDDNRVYAFAEIFDNTMIPIGGSTTKASTTTKAPAQAPATADVAPVFGLALLIAAAIVFARRRAR